MNGIESHIDTSAYSFSIGVLGIEGGSVDPGIEGSSATCSTTFISVVGRCDIWAGVAAI